VTQSALPRHRVRRVHLIWLSTTNSYDASISGSDGYVPVKSEEFPGFDNYRVKAASTLVIACNEMLLCKIPMKFTRLMLHMHHELPMEEADKIKLQVEQMQGQRDSSGRV